MSDANASPTWPAIRLSWRQSFAAFWCVAWPSLLMGISIIAIWPNDNVQAASISANAVSLSAQALFVPRLVRKQFRLFRIEVVREDHSPGDRLSFFEIASVSIHLLWPQLAFFVAINSLASLLDRTGSGLGSIMFWITLFLIGPLAIKLAVQAQYSRFKLQPFGIRYI